MSPLAEARAAVAVARASLRAAQAATHVPTDRDRDRQDAEASVAAARDEYIAAREEAAHAMARARIAGDPLAVALDRAEAALTVWRQAHAARPHAAARADRLTRHDSPRLAHSDVVLA